MKDMIQVLCLAKDFLMFLVNIHMGMINASNK